MIRRCDWCSKPMGEKAPFDDKSVTGAICPKCKAKMEKLIDEHKKEKNK